MLPADEDVSAATVPIDGISYAILVVSLAADIHAQA